MSTRALRTLAAFSVLALSAPAVPAQESTTPFDAARVVADYKMQMELVDDINGDGYPDAVGYGWRGDHLNGFDAYFLINDQQGGFQQVYVEEYHDYNFNWPEPYLHMGLSNVLPDGNRNLLIAMQSRMQRWRIAPDGTLLSQSSISTPPYEVTGLLVEDINGDGNADVVTADDGYATTSASVRLMRGFDQGHYSADAYAIAPLPGPLTQLRNMNGTNDVQAPDMVVQSGTDLVMIRWSGGTWDGNLSVSHTFELGLSEDAMVTVGDIDGDEDEDVVVFDPPGYTVLRRTGPQDFAVEAPVAGGPATHLIDVDLDGDLDGLCCGGGSGSPGDPVHNVDGSTFQVSLNDGSGGFAPAFGIPGMGARHLAGAVDVDLDGDIDLLGGRCVVYAHGPITEAPAPSIGVVGAREEGYFDVDGDGDEDLHAGLGTVMRSRGDGSFESGATWVDAPAGTTYDGPGFPGDFDGDGDVDLIASAYSDALFDGMHLLRNNGGGGYVDTGPALADPTWLDLAGNGLDAPEESLAEDLDGDGDVDLVIHTLQGSRLSWLFLNDGDGLFTFALALPDEVVRHVADLDGDGVPDLVTSTDLIGFRLGMGNGLFGSRTPLLRSDHDAHADIYAVADLDADGDLDVAVTRELSQAAYQGTAHLYRNDGSAYFVMEWLDFSSWFVTDGYPRRIALAADVSGDGLDDLLLYPTVRNGPAVTILVQDGLGGFAAPIQQVFFGEGHLTVGFLAALASDADSDGDVDLLTDRFFENTQFHGDDAGGRRQFGVGSPGNGGMVPTLGAKGPFRADSQAELRITGGTGGSLAFVTVAFAESAVPNFPFPGMTAYTEPWFRRLPFPLDGAPGEVGTGSFTLQHVVNPGMAGLTLYHQVYVVDPAAPSGFSSSGGLELEYR